MNATENPVAVVLAAGLSRRYAGEKLLATFRGKALAAHIADVLVEMNLRRRLAVCPRGSTERADVFAARDFEIVWNDDPELGMGHSLALGAIHAQTLSAEAVLVCLADMPNVTGEHLSRLVAAGQGGVAVATEAGSLRMPPAFFPASLLPELAILTGDRGARTLLAGAHTVHTDASLVRDFDTRPDFID